MNHGQFIHQPKMGPFLPDVAADVAGPTAFGLASVIRISRPFQPVRERWFVYRSLVHMLQGGTEWHSHKRAHRPRLAHAEVVGVLVLAFTSVPRERAALLREEAATTHAGLGISGSRADTGGGAYRSPLLGMRIARSDVGNRPSNRFPYRCLQRNGSGTSLLRQLSKPVGGQL